MKRFFSFWVIFSIVLTFSGTASFATETDAPRAISEPTLLSEAAIVMDAATGQILFEQNAYAKEYPASITKILTTLVALEEGDITSTITMSEDAVYGIDSDSSKIYLDVGEEISLEDALYAVMLASANEAAWGVAEHIGGTLNAFCSMMNAKAASLGCVNSNFVNANGLSNDNHYTCAYDMALITREALQNEEFCKITSTTSYTIPPTNMSDEPRNLTQGNRLIQEGSEYYYQYCQGGKTGYTQASGGTLVAWAEKDGMQLICVTLNTTGNSDNYTDTIALFDYCFNGFTSVKPLENYEFSPTDLTAAESCLNSYYGGTNLGTMNLSVDKDQTIYIPENVANQEADIEFVLSTGDISDNVIGRLTVSYDSMEYISQDVTYSGYISSEDDEAIQEAYANGTLTPQKEKKSHKGLIIFIIILALAGAALYHRIQYVRKQREAYIKRREQAKKNGKSF